MVGVAACSLGGGLGHIFAFYRLPVPLVTLAGRVEAAGLADGEAFVESLTAGVVAVFSVGPRSEYHSFTPP